MIIFGHYPIICQLTGLNSLILIFNFVNFAIFIIIIKNYMSDKLPDYVKEIINQKSSRNPGSRFARKIHTLLSYVETNPEAYDQIGLQWISDERFKMNKKLLKEVLGIKENSLNVNLKKLNFTQTSYDKLGWTEWYKKDFNKIELNTFQNDNFPITDEQFPRIMVNSVFTNQSNQQNIPEDAFSKASHIVLGFINEDRKQQVLKQAIQIWQEIANNDSTDSLSGEYFLLRLAKKWQLPHQDFNNALSVLSNILISNDTSVITFLDFYKIYCAFGPEPTVMNKISDLLEVCAGEDGWLYFGFTVAEIKSVTMQYAYFDDNEPNCLILVNGSNTTKVWNIPDIIENDIYIYAEDSNMYQDWQSFFDLTTFEMPKIQHHPEENQNENQPQIPSQENLNENQTQNSPQENIIENQPQVSLQENLIENQPQEIQIVNQSQTSPQENQMFT